MEKLQEVAGKQEMLMGALAHEMKHLLLLLLDIQTLCGM